MSDHAEIVRDGLYADWKSPRKKAALAALDALVARAEAAEARVAELTEALRAIADTKVGKEPWRKPLPFEIARAAIAKENAYERP